MVEELFENVGPSSSDGREARTELAELLAEFGDRYPGVGLLTDVRARFHSHMAAVNSFQEDDTEAAAHLEAARHHVTLGTGKAAVKAAYLLAEGTMATLTGLRASGAATFHEAAELLRGVEPVDLRVEALRWQVWSLWLIKEGYGTASCPLLEEAQARLAGLPPRVNPALRFFVLSQLARAYANRHYETVQAGKPEDVADLFRAEAMVKAARSVYPERSRDSSAKASLETTLALIHLTRQPRRATAALRNVIASSVREGDARRAAEAMRAIQDAADLLCERTGIRTDGRVITNSWRLPKEQDFLERTAEAMLDGSGSDLRRIGLSALETVMVFLHRLGHFEPVPFPDFPLARGSEEEVGSSTPGSSSDPTASAIRLTAVAATRIVGEGLASRYAESSEGRPGFATSREDFTTAPAALLANPPELVLIEAFNDPKNKSGQLLRTLRTRLPDVRTVMHGVHTEGIARELVAAGCSAFLFYDQEMSDLDKAIGEVLAGGTYHPFPGSAYRAEPAPEPDREYEVKKLLRSRTAKAKAEAEAEPKPTVEP
jgi:DNA-binding NarL/FixJ family response regulator